MSIEADAARYYAELDDVLATLDEAKIRAFLLRWGHPLATTANSLVFWCGIHKTITSRTTLPMALRAKSKAWLHAGGFQSWDDGDVPVNR